MGLDSEANVVTASLPYGKQSTKYGKRATNPKLYFLIKPAFFGMNPNELKAYSSNTISRDKFDMTILLIEHDMRLVGGIYNR